MILDVTERDDDVTRRTRLAAERTWLAWWRSGVAAATAAVGVGGVVPGLIGGERTPYVVLGAGYAVLAAGVFVAAGWRRVKVDRALDRGDYEEIGGGTVIAMTAVALILALGTLAVIVAQP
ncbi:MAG: putative rane protein [Thermoleophilaceae bacterium]|nr:putative rane protein [Thermoleophilaceae bacterium]